MPERSPYFHKISSKTISKLKCLEDMRFYVSLKKGTLKNEMEQHQKSKIKKKASRIKTIIATFSVTGEW